MRDGFRNMVAEIWIIAALFVISWAFAFFLAVSVMKTGSQGIEELDVRLAEVITDLVENLSQLAGDIEPPNPIVGILAQYMQQKLEGSGENLRELKERDDKGQFTKLVNNG